MKPARRYTREEIDRALMALATCGGSGEASRLLEQQGLVIGDRTLRNMRHAHQERYLELHATRGREIEDVAVAGMRELVLQASEVEREALAATLRDLKAGNVKDPSTAARNAAVTKGINADKLLVLTGRPSEISEHRGGDELLRGLASRVGILFDADATVEEINAPELPEAA